ncbi:MAG: leucine-rich repeat domain-containing protein [Acutalibacteraceae bacterium]
MKKKTNSKILKNLLLIFSMTVLCALFTVSASAQTISGECGKQGNNVTWTYDTETETMTIQGEGEMEDYLQNGSWTNSPWEDNDDITIKSLVIRDGVTSVGAGAFANCENLETVEIADSVKSIGDSAFFTCSALKQIEIPAEINYIGEEAFDLCFSLERIDVSKDNLNYSSDDCGVLFNKDKTVLITYPEKNQSKEYKMPNSVKTINYRAFYGNVFIEKIELSEQLEIIEDLAFMNCVSLNNITFPETLKSVGFYSFGMCWSLKNIVLPQALETVESNAFFNLWSLESITIKGMNTKIDDSKLCGLDCKLSDEISCEEFVNKFVKIYTSENEEEKEAIGEELGAYLISTDDIEYVGIIRCHDGSTAEAYAMENGIACERVHFFGDWTYDGDCRSHECSICGLTEVETIDSPEEPAQTNIFIRIINQIRQFINKIIDFFKSIGA